jgi:hypothetical protein
MVNLFLMLPNDSNNLSLMKAQLFEAISNTQKCFPFHAWGCQVVDAWGGVVLYP